jgi:hypothetical protein
MLPGGALGVPGKGGVSLTGVLILNLNFGTGGGASWTV